MEFHRSLFKAGLQQKWNGHHSTRPFLCGKTARDSLGKSTKPKPWRLKRGGGFEFGTFGRLLCDLDVRIPCFVSRLLHSALLRLYKAGRPIGRNCSREAGASEGAAVVPDSDAGLRVGTYRHSQTHPPTILPTVLRPSSVFKHFSHCRYLRWFLHVTCIYFRRM